MFEINEVERFYNEYGVKEWERLDGSAYGKLIYLLHKEFLQPYIGEGKRVLDAGCGAGRFSVLVAQMKSRVTLLDLSETQLEIARKKCNEFNVSEYIDEYVHNSVTHMKDIADNSFDTVICYGAVLNYLHEETAKAISELVRVTKNNGEILFSVNSRNGVLRACATEMKMPLCDFWGKPAEWGIFEVINTGDETAYATAKHPPRHYFTADEIKKLLRENKLVDIELGAAPAIMTGLRGNIEILYHDKVAWETVLYMEKSQYLNESIVDCGEFLLARAKVNKGE